MDRAKVELLLTLADELGFVVASRYTPVVPLLPPPLSPRVYLVASARRRGISTTLIGRALGFSQQRANQYISKYEKYHGPILEPVRLISRQQTASVRISKCIGCGSSIEKRAGDHYTVYCSNKCRGKHYRRPQRS